VLTLSHLADAAALEQAAGGGRDAVVERGGEPAVAGCLAPQPAPLEQLVDRSSLSLSVKSSRKSRRNSACSAKRVS